MAKIFGIQLKNVKQFTGWEGYGVNASVYLDGKRIGTFNDRADGGPLDWTVIQKKQRKPCSLE